MREVFCFGVVVAKLWRRGGTEEEEGGKPAGYDGGGGEGKAGRTIVYGLRGISGGGANASLRVTSHREW